MLRRSVRLMGWVAVGVAMPQVLLAGPMGPVTWGDTAFVGGGWGRMAQLDNGDWLCVTTEYPRGTDSYLRLLRSTTAGRNWLPVAEVKEAGRTLDNGELVVLPNGTVLLTMRSLVPDESYRLPVYASTDGGTSWILRSTIDASEGPGARGLWEPDLWVVNARRLVVTYSNEKHAGYSQVISERVSTDQGVTWSGEHWAVAEPGGGGLRPGMSQMARMGNGQYILVYEIVNAGNADVHYKISEDGETWPAGVGTRIPCQHCGPFVVSLPNDLLLVSSCENEISFSEDFGRTWQKMDSPAWDLGFLFSWPAIYVTGPGEVGVMVVPGGVQIRFGRLLPHAGWPDPYRETFDRGTDAGWVVYGGTRERAGGEYLLSNAGTFGMALVGDGFWTDGTLEADVMLTSPGNAGVMVRTTNPGESGPDDAFGYYVGLDTGGRLILGRMNPGWESIASAAMPVDTGIWYHLIVTLEGDALSVYVNDAPSPLITHRDATHHRGQIGVRAFQCDARFDNVSFSNAVPLRVSARQAGNRLDLSWPETSVAVKLSTLSNLTNRLAEVVDSPAYVRTNRQWRVSLAEPSPAHAFYWLQGQ